MNKSFYFLISDKKMFTCTCTIFAIVVILMFNKCVVKAGQTATKAELGAREREGS